MVYVHTVSLLCFLLCCFSLMLILIVFLYSYFPIMNIFDILVCSYDTEEVWNSDIINV